MAHQSVLIQIGSINQFDPCFKTPWLTRLIRRCSSMLANLMAQCYTKLTRRITLPFLNDLFDWCEESALSGFTDVDVPSGSPETLYIEYNFSIRNSKTQIIKGYPFFSPSLSLKARNKNQQRTAFIFISLKQLYLLLIRNRTKYNKHFTIRTSDDTL